MAEEEGEAAPPALPPRLCLPQVTLIAIDTRQPERALLAMKHSLRQVAFRDAYLFTDKRLPPEMLLSTTADQDIADPANGGETGSLPSQSIRRIPIPGLASIRAYSEFMLWDLPVYSPLFAEHFLVVQADGFVLNPSAWDEAFLSYDYIGAPWEDGTVGNGGFSLRSRRLLDTLADSSPNLRPGNPHPEDDVLCRSLRKRLEALGLRFAPTDIGHRFSVENAPYTGSFGYHGWRTERLSNISLDNLSAPPLPISAQSVAAPQVAIASLSSQPEHISLPKQEQQEQIEALYIEARDTPSDINQHVETLAQFARDCRHVTDFGARRGISTRAFLYARPQRVVAYNLRRENGMDRVERTASLVGIDFAFRQEDVLSCEIEETDLLLLDTHHTYEQVKRELERHADKVRKYLVFHDTVIYGERGEIRGSVGILPAITEFLQRDEGHWTIAARYTHNNGLMVLKRVASSPDDVVVRSAIYPQPVSNDAPIRMLAEPERNSEDGINIKAGTYAACQISHTPAQERSRNQTVTGRIRLLAAANDHYLRLNMDHWLTASRNYNADLPKPIVLTVDCDAESQMRDQFDHVEFRRVDSYLISTINKNFCFQHGAFLPFVEDFSDDDVIVMIDGDCVIQRPFYADELTMMEAWQDGDFGANWNAQNDTFEAEARRLSSKRPPKAIASNWGVEGKPFCNAGFLIAKKKDFAKMLALYEANWNKIQTDITHIAYQQWLINWCFWQPGLNLRMVPFDLHVHAHYGNWYPVAVDEDGTVRWQGQPTFVRHKINWRNNAFGNVVNDWTKSRIG